MTTHEVAMRSLRFLTLAVLVSLALLHAAAARLSGRIYDGASKQNIPDLTIKLVPPKDVNAPERITSTDHGGRFNFGDVAPGKYLLEVYQGLTLVHREVVLVNGEVQKEIALYKVARPPQPRPR
jgi:hypothetical protein